MRLSWRLRPHISWKDQATDDLFTEIQDSFRCRPVCFFHTPVVDMLVMIRWHIAPPDHGISD